MKSWKWWDTTLKDPDSYRGVLNMNANRRGNYETASQGATFGATNTVTGSAINADVVQLVGGTARMFAPTATKIYEVALATAVDRSRGGGSYTSGSFWHCAQYGDATIYTNREDNVQTSASTTFSDLGGTPPKARFCCVQNLALVLAAYYDGANTYEDGIWISDIGAITTWTPSASNEAANFRLLETPGAIKAIATLGREVIVFKENSMYRLEYVGLPFIWQAHLVSDSIGAAGQGTVCNCGDRLVFGGDAGWYSFDGRFPQEIAPAYPAGSHNVTAISARDYATGSSHYEPISGLAHFAARGATPFTIQVSTGQFGAYNVVTSGGAQTIRSLFRGTGPASIAAALGSAATGCTAAYMVASGSDSVPISMRTIWGSQTTAVQAYVQTSYYGAHNSKTLWTRVIPALGFWGSGVTYAGNMVGTLRDRSDLSEASPVTTGTVAASGSTPRFDINKSSRFASFQIDTYATPMEIAEIVVESRPAGRE